MVTAASILKQEKEVMKLLFYLLHTYGLFPDLSGLVRQVKFLEDLDYLW